MIEFGYFTIYMIKYILNLMNILFILSGFISVIVQTLFVRESMILCEGNEFVIGIVLSAWLLGAGAGSFLIAFSNRKYGLSGLRTKLFLSFALIPVFLMFSYAFINNYRAIFGIYRGEMLSPFHIILSSTASLFPMGMFFGFHFALGSSILKSKTGEYAGVKIYVLEAVGFFTGALVTMFFLFHLAGGFGMAVTAGMLSIIGAWIIIRNSNIKNAYLLLSFLFFVFASFVSHRFTGDTDVLYEKDTRISRISVYSSDNVKTLFYNGKYAFEYPYVTNIENEEFACMPSLFSDNFEKILVIGGFSKYINDILKIKGVEKIDYIEHDPMLLKEIQKIFGFNEESGINAVYENIHEYLNTKKDYYDIIYLCFDSPDSLLSNSYYTSEVFTKIKSSLKDDGVFAFKVISNEAYLK